MNSHDTFYVHWLGNFFQESYEISLVVKWAAYPLED